MKSILYLLLGVGAISSEARPVPVSFAADVLRFKAEASENKLTVHRSGQFRKDEKLFETAGFERFPQGYEEDELPGNRNEAHAYDVVYDGDILEIGKLLKHVGGNQELVEEPFHPKGKDLILRGGAERNAVPASAMEVDSLVEIGKRLAKTNLKVFRNRIEYESRDLKFANGKLFEVDIRFRRIFKGMVVRKNVSYVYLTLGADGTIRSITVRWPKFVRAKPLGLANIETAFAKAGRHFEGSPVITSTDGADTPLHATVKGVARSWVPSQDGLRIHPGYSFLAVVDYDKGDPATFIYDYSKDE